MFRKSTKFEGIWSAVVALALLLALFSSTGAVQAQGSGPTLAPMLAPVSGEVVADHYIVVYKTDFIVANAEDSIRAAVAADGGEVKFMYKAALNGYSAYLPEKALAAVRANPAVDYVEADAVIKLSQEEVGAEAVQYGATWGLDRIDQRALPLSTTYNYLYDGTGVNAYIIDTGIRSTHTEFGVRASKDFDSIGDGQNGNDCAGHGTHVAGTIGGTTYGVAKNVTLHGVRVLDCSGSGSTSTVVAGIDWVTANRVLPAVANMSLGGGASTAIDTASNNLINSGVVLAVAGGNDNLNACNYSPARVPNAITVGSTTSTDARSSFSNWGTCLDIFAPGSFITSAWYTGDTDTNTISGTSMATPHVAGAAALYLQANPGATPATVRNIMVSTATLSVITDPGTGSPNALLYSLFEPQPVTTVPTTLAPIGAITTTKPAYQWSPVTGAVQYRYQLVKGATTIYIKTVGATVCTSGICKNTPTTVLAFGAYKWRVQAKIGSVWKPYSPYRAFTVKFPSPKAGYWSGGGLNFRVVSSLASAKVSKFRIYINVPACGIYGASITRTLTDPIVNWKFSFTGSYYASGTFNKTTKTNASGRTGLNRFPIPGCGSVSGGPWSWSASWASANVPPTFTIDQSDIVFEADAPQQPGIEYFNVEKVEP